jgi:hypothetical protein
MEIHQYMHGPGFLPEGGWGISPPSNDSRGISPLNLIFWGEIFFLVFNILITLSVFLRHLEADHQGGLFPLTVKK